MSLLCFLLVINTSRVYVELYLDDNFKLRPHGYICLLRHQLNCTKQMKLNLILFTKLVGTATLKGS